MVPGATLHDAPGSRPSPQRQCQSRGRVGYEGNASQVCEQTNGLRRLMEIDRLKRTCTVGGTQNLSRAHRFGTTTWRVKDHAAPWHVPRQAPATLAVLVKCLLALACAIMHMLASVHYVVRPKHGGECPCHGWPMHDLANRTTCGEYVCSTGRRLSEHSGPAQVQE